MATETVRVIKGANAAVIRNVASEVSENQDFYIEKFPGLDVTAFKRGMVGMHGKVFATIRKKNLNPGQAAESLINRFLGNDSDGGVSVDDLLAEIE